MPADSSDDESIAVQESGEEEQEEVVQVHSLRSMIKPQRGDFSVTDGTSLASLPGSPNSNKVGNQLSPRRVVEQPNLEVEMTGEEHSAMLPSPVRRSHPDGRPVQDEKLVQSDPTETIPQYNGNPDTLYYGTLSEEEMMRRYKLGAPDRSRSTLSHVVERRRYRDNLLQMIDDASGDVRQDSIWMAEADLERT